MEGSKQEYKRIGVWNRPKSRRAYTLFGSGQHHGKTDCEYCHKTLQRASGMQKCCGPYYDKNSCAYKYELRKKKQWYLMKKFAVKTEKIKYIYNNTDKRSPILVCKCGNKYIQTREGQTKCLLCIYGK